MEQNPTFFPMPEVNTFMSEQINEIAVALSAFQGSIKQPALNKTVKGTYTFHYADLSEVMKAAAPELQKNGLAVTQILNGGKLITLLTHKSGQWFKSELNMGDQPITKHQAFGSALTYLKRYSYCAILGIVADDDDDANRADDTGNTTHPKNGSGTSALAYTGAQLNEALAQLDSCKTRTDATMLWNEWSKKCPALCVQNGEFYKAVSAKMPNLPEA